MRMQGNGKEVTRCGHHRGDASVNSWSTGMQVSVRKDTDGSSDSMKDVFNIRLTSGSSYSGQQMDLLNLTGQQIHDIITKGDSQLREITPRLVDKDISMRELFLSEYNNRRKVIA